MVLVIMSKIESNEKKHNEVEKPSQGSEMASVRMNINISKAFHKKIKQKALDEDSTITEVVIKALKKYLEG